MMPRSPARPGRPEVSRGIGILMLAEAVTLGIASYLHRDGNIRLGFATIRGERFIGASVPEAVIGFVLAVAAAAILAAARRARPTAIGATAFALVGVLYGITVTIREGRASDVAYHATLLAVLLASMVMLLRPAGGRPGPAQDQRRPDPQGR